MRSTKMYAYGTNFIEICPSFIPIKVKNLRMSGLKCLRLKKSIFLSKITIRG